LIFLAVTITLWPLMSVLILSMSFAVVCLPVHRRLSRHISPALSAGVTTGGIFLLLTVLVFGIAYFIYTNADALTQLITGIITAIELFLKNSPYLTQIAAEIAGALKGLVQFIIGYVSGVALYLPFLIVQVIIFFCSFYLFMLKGEEMLAQILRRLPEHALGAVNRLMRITGDTLYSVYVVSFQVSLFTFVVSLPVFYVLGYGHIILFSLIAGLFQLIPVLGPQVLIAVLALFALSIGDTRGFLYLIVIAYPAISLSADFFLRPRLMGRRTAIHPVLMMIGVLGGLALLGVIGFILGPLFTALSVAAYDILMGDAEGGTGYSE
ncbi:MAG: AI-2E family transporter, partial [Methanomicrobiales archaeon]|nr:AI-2E family transporter [Methanomicrobiales archaeon]